MKTKILAGLIASIAATGALAQTNVTLYGVIDTAIRYTSNNAATNGGTNLGSTTYMTEGAFQGPRFGLKGTEDLGGGTTAIFQLENGFFANNGTFDQQGQIFGRQEFFGLSNTTGGTLTLGRQYGIAFDVLGNYDPLGVGNLPENEWDCFVFGLRFDNTIKYTNNYGPIGIELQYSIGGVAGNTSGNSTYGAALTYTQGALGAGGVYQESKDTVGKRVQVAGLGGSYVVGPVTGFLYVTDAKRDAQFNVPYGTPSPGADYTQNFDLTHTRTDDLAVIGALWQATPALGFTVGYMYDNVKNATDTSNGKDESLYAIADYNLSKRTDVYIEVDYSKMTGGEINNPGSPLIFGAYNAYPGGVGGRAGVALGLRTHF